MQFTPLTDDENETLKFDRRLVDTMRRFHLPHTSFAQTQADLELLQALLKEYPWADPEAEAVALGTVLGDVFAHELDHIWVKLTDEQGQSLVLRHAQSKHVICPRTMLLKRFEDDPNRIPDIHFLYSQVCNIFRQLARTRPSR